MYKYIVLFVLLFPVDGLSGVPGSLPNQPRCWQGEVLRLSVRKDSKILDRWIGKSPFPLPVPDWGWDQGKSGTRATAVKWYRGRC